MRLIDADKLLTKEHQYYNYLADEWFVPVRDIEDAPTADVVERKKGRWVTMSDADGTFYACSECGEWSKNKTRFCAECGADMRGEKADD